MRRFWEMRAKRILLLMPFLKRQKVRTLKQKHLRLHLNQRKKWIAFNSRPEGEIIIDQLAKERP